MLIHTGHSPPIAKLPAEILLLIAELAYFETRAKLVRCNKWFYESCTPLLYRDIYLRSPIQLINLSESQTAINNLARTESLFISETIYSSREWQGIPRHHNPVKYLLCVLRTTISLYRLQVLGSEQYGLLMGNNIFASEIAGSLIREAVDDPTFLPKLSLLINNPKCTGLYHLCYDRPVPYYSTWDTGHLHVNIFPTLDPSKFDKARDISAVARSRLASCSGQDLSAKQVGQLIRESMDASLRSETTYLRLIMRSPDAIINNKPSPFGNCIDWVETMLSAAACPKLDTLLIEFQPTPPFRPAAVQYLALKKLQEVLPELVDAQFSYPDVYWSKGGPREDQVLPRPDLANIDWTPGPLQDWIGEVFMWWSNILGLDIRTHDQEELKRTIAQLRDGMLVWWLEDFVPSENELFETLLMHGLIHGQG